MTTLQYATLVPSDGYVVLPPEFRGREVVVSDREAILRSIESRDLLSAVEITDEEIERLKHEHLEKRQQRIAAEKARIMSRTPEERRVAAEKFMQTWEGCLEGVPHMTAKEIRAERLEKKYGNKDDNSTD